MNKYLEKIAALNGAGIIDKITGFGRSMYKNNIKPVGSVVGSQVHNAFGGAYRNFAFNHMGITNPRELAKFSSNKESIQRIKEHFKNSPTYTNMSKSSNGISPLRARRMAEVNTLKDLRNQTITGRIVTGGLAAGTLYGANKLRSIGSTNTTYQQPYSYY